LLRAVDTIDFAPPPVVLHFLFVAHFAFVSDAEAATVEAAFQCLALVCGEFALLPVLRLLDPALTLALCLAVASRRVRAPAVAPAAVLVALLRFECDFVARNSADMGIDEWCNWREPVDRRCDPWAKWSDEEMECALDALATPLRLMLDCLQYSPSVPEVDDQAIEDVDAEVDVTDD
jgi:hypothetical protein